MSTETDEQKIKRLEAEIAEAKKPKAITFKVALKGGLSVYGLQRMPVTLYKEQWARLLDQKEPILQFIADNNAALKCKS